jgi:hypothetical protein
MDHEPPLPELPRPRFNAALAPQAAALSSMMGVETKPGCVVPSIRTTDGENRGERGLHGRRDSEQQRKEAHPPGHEKARLQLECQPVA